MDAKRAPRTIKVFTSNATHAALDAVAQGFERASGNALSITADSAKVMLARITGGEAADIAVLNAPDIDALVSLGLIEARTRQPFARSRVGLAVRKGAPHPDISTVEAFRRALLEGKSVAHTVHGASGMYFPRLIERLGIADAVKPKTVTRPGGLIAKVVVAGEAEMAVQQISELLAVPGVELVGPLPEEIQMVFESAAGIFTTSENGAAAKALLAFFSKPASAALLKQHGLEAGQ